MDYGSLVLVEEATTMKSFTQNTYITLSLHSGESETKLSHAMADCSVGLWSRQKRIFKNENIVLSGFLGLTYAYCDTFIVMLKENYKAKYDKEIYEILFISLVIIFSLINIIIQALTAFWVINEKLLIFL